MCTNAVPIHLILVDNAFITYSFNQNIKISVQKGLTKIKLFHKSRSAAVQITLKSSTTSLLKKGWRDPLMLVFTDLKISKEILVLSQLITTG